MKSYVALARAPAGEWSRPQGRAADLSPVTCFRSEIGCRRESVPAGAGFACRDGSGGLPCLRATSLSVSPHFLGPLRGPSLLTLAETRLMVPKPYSDIAESQGDSNRVCCTMAREVPGAANADPFQAVFNARTRGSPDLPSSIHCFGLSVVNVVVGASSINHGPSCFSTIRTSGSAPLTARGELQLPGTRCCR